MTTQKNLLLIILLTMKKYLNNFLLLNLFLLLPQALQASNYALVIHGGAGWFSDMPDEQIKGIEEGLEDALKTGYAILEAGGSSTDAVVEATYLLECARAISLLVDFSSNIAAHVYYLKHGRILPRRQRVA